MTDSAPAGSTWRPPQDLPMHNGADIPASMEFFQPPGAEIGDLVSACSTLTVGVEPRPLISRIITAVGLAVVIYLIGQLACQSEPQGDREVAQIVFGILAVLAATIVWFAQRFHHHTTFVGTKGLAWYTLSGSRDATPKEQLLRFTEVSDLRTHETRQYVNGVYSGTHYQYDFADAAGTIRFKIHGSYRSEQGNPPATDLYHFAKAAELAWTRHKFDETVTELEQRGYIQFNLTGKNCVRVGPGWIEFNIGNVQERLSAEEIAELTVHSGTFTIKTKDARWFSRKGWFSFTYGDMANARLFVLALDRLLGFQF